MSKYVQTSCFMMIQMMLWYDIWYLYTCLHVLFDLHVYIYIYSWLGCSITCSAAVLYKMELTVMKWLSVSFGVLLTSDSDGLQGCQRLIPVTTKGYRCAGSTCIIQYIERYTMNHHLVYEKCWPHLTTMFYCGLFDVLLHLAFCQWTCLLIHWSPFFKL